MPPYGNEPDWATPGDTSAPPTTPSAQGDGGASAAVADGGRSGGGRIRFILVVVSCLNFGIAGMMAALGVLTILKFKGESFQEIAATPFLASYMILFALLLFFYELMWWMPVPTINRTLRKNFGFMYGLKGKGLYLIFVAFLCLGLVDEQDQVVKILGWATGIGFLAIGILHFFLICSNPDFLDQYRPPTAGLQRMSSTDGGQDENVV